MTYQHQDTLKKLPIPDLQETCTNYLDVLKPLQTEAEHKDTVAAVEEFLKSGTGEYLDAELRQYAKTRNSYIEQFWYDSYLNYDNPVVLNLNPFFLLEDDPFNNASSNPQVKRATTLTLLSLKFIQALKRETLPPDVLKNGQPLCMYQYGKLFGSLRIPTNDGCVMQSDTQATHIVVLSRSQFYWFDVMDNDANLILLELELMINFTSIVQDALETSPMDVAKSSFGVLTTENRRTWLSVRAGMQRNATNAEIINIIDSALFIMCLDDIECEDLSLLSKNMLCGLLVLDKGIQVGTCTNRWYDKLQIIITKNGKAGINFEHTGVDGHTVLRFVSDVYTDSILAFAQLINGNTPSLWKESSLQPTVTDKITIPRKLEWDLTPDLSLALRFSETRLSDLINQNEFRHLEFKSYGSTLIKKWKFSPDAFVQMAFQATYYALYGKVECTYEPAMTKNFFHGRTEAIRTVSNESNLFVRKFFDATVSTKEKLDYLLEACKKHSEQTRRCSQGKGVDRHLFALFSIWKRYFPEKHENSDLESDKTVVGDNIPEKQYFQKLPEIFADAGWDKLNNTILSTSNCGNPALRLFGFGPVSSNGFGIGYIIKDASISICALSKHRQTQRFLVTLESYLLEIEKLMNELKLLDKRQGQVQEVKTFTHNLLQPSVRQAQPSTPSATSLLLGGYGYFDMGEDDIKSRGQLPEPPFLSRNNSTFTIREIGKKLRLSEY